MNDALEFGSGKPSPTRKPGKPSTPWQQTLANPPQPLTPMGTYCHYVSMFLLHYIIMCTSCYSNHCLLLSGYRCITSLSSMSLLLSPWLMWSRNCRMDKRLQDILRVLIINFVVAATHCLCQLLYINYFSWENHNNKQNHVPATSDLTRNYSTTRWRCVYHGKILLVFYRYVPALASRFRRAIHNAVVYQQIVVLSLISISSTRTHTRIIRLSFESAKLTLADKQ